MNIAHYLLQVNLYLVAFYALYILLLAKETYFVINRIYLIGAGILSLVIPYIRLDWFAKAEVHQQFYVSVDQILSQAVVVTEVEKHFNWGLLIVAVYVFGVLFFTAKLIFKLLHLKKLFKTGINEQAFSFLNKKVVSRSLPQQETINHHENIHIKQLHTLDVLFFEVLGIINWFNPVSYLFKKAVKNIHEYLADEETARLQSDKETYALLLLSHALKVSPNTLTNSFFNKSMLKKRIYMLHKQRSNKVAILKYGLFVPLFGLALVLSSSTINKNQGILSISNQIPLSNLADVKSALTAPVLVAQSITQSQNQEPKNQKNMKNTLKAAILVAGTILGTNANAQTDTSNLQGKVTSTEIIKNGDTIKTEKSSYRLALLPPLYVIDGSIVTKGDLDKIRPSDIESVNVLKDKSAIELYGDKATGGVVFVITKNGIPSNAEAKKVVDAYRKKATEAKAERDDKYKNALVIINGLEQKKKGMEAVNSFLDNNKFGKMTNKMLYGKEAIDAYGDKGKYGVIIITATQENTKDVVTRTGQDNSVYDFVSIEKQPEFPGGIAKFYAYVGKNLKYPAMAVQNNVQGKVFLSFIVEKDGKLTDITITRGLGSGTDEEAVRLLKSSARWTPGIQDGKPVRVKYNININFTLGK